MEIKPEFRDVEDSRSLKMLVTENGISEKDASLFAFASTGDVDRDNEIIDPGAFTETLQEYRKNPVVLWAHQHFNPPIGKSLSEQVRDDGLIFQPQFAVKENPQAALVWGLYKGGYLNAFSVGFIPGVYEERESKDAMVRVYTQVELLEVSAVPVPSNRGALALRSITGMNDLRTLAQKELIEALTKYDIEMAKSTARAAEQKRAEIIGMINKNKELVMQLQKSINEVRK